MPNYDGPKLREIPGSVKSFLQTYIADAEDNNFPLTREEVQSIIVPPTTLELMKCLTNEHNVSSLSKYNDYYFWLPSRDDVPRSAQINIEGWPAFLTNTSHCYSYGARNEPQKHRSASSLTADLMQLDQGQVAKLIEWANRAVTARRTVNMIERKVKEYINLEPTLWHILTQFPSLKLGFPFDLKERSSETPRYPRHYGWGSKPEFADWFETNQRYFQVIDYVLLKTSLLPQPQSSRLKISVWNWFRRDNEPF